MSLLKIEKNLISVIIVNWNGEKWFKDCLFSLYNQTFKKIEVLVVDNNSSDKSVEYLEKNFPKVKIIKNKKNVGLSTAFNIGVEKSKGEYIMLLNNDTFFKKDFVQKLFTFYKKHNYSVIAPIEKRFDEKEKIKCNTTIDITGSPAYYLPNFSRWDKFFYLSVCFLFSRNDYLASKGLDDNYFMYYEDVDWFWRLSLLGKKFTYVNDVIISHAGGGSSGKGLNYNTFLWRNQNCLQTLIKNYSFLTLVFVLPIYIVQNLIEAIALIFVNPKISKSYIQGWIFNIKNINKIIKKRKWVQDHRVVSDLEIFKKMYPGSGKLLLLYNYFFQKNEK